MQQKKSSSHSKVYQWIGLAVIIILIGNFGYQMYKKFYFKKQNVTNKLCSIQQQSCMTQMRNGMSVSLDVNPKPFHADETVNVTAIIKGASPSHVSIFSFPVGQTPQVEPTILKNISTGQYSAKMKLPPAEKQEHQWVMMLVMQTHGQSYAVPFRFKM